MFDDEFGAAGVADERSGARIVHRIREIADQDDVEPKLRHLANAEAAVKDADVSMHSHEGDVGDAFLFQEVVDFLTALADAIESDDVDARVLALPRIRRTFPFLHDRVIATAGRVVDGEVAFFHGLAWAAIKNRHRGRRRGCTLHAPAPRCSFVKRHRVTGGMDDHYPEAAGRADHLIHPRDHRGDALRREAARVRVPHVTDDDGRLGHLPAQHVFRDTVFAAGRLAGPSARLEPERAPDARPVGDGDVFSL